MYTSYNLSCRSLKVRPVLLVLISFVFLVPANAIFRTDMSITHARQPMRFSAVKFAGSGGVISAGDVQFVTAGGDEIEMGSLTLRFNPEPLNEQVGEFKKIAIERNGDLYWLPLHPDLVSGVVDFVGRNSTVAFTIPVGATIDQKFVDEEKLVRFFDLFSPFDECYVSAEFTSSTTIEFLKWLDLRSEVQMVEENAEGIMSAVNTVLAASEPQEGLTGTYANGDFTIRYKARFEDEANPRVVDIGGLPLRYSWFPEPVEASDDETDMARPLVYDVESFVMPELQEEWITEAKTGYRRPLAEALLDFRYEIDGDEMSMHERGRTTLQRESILFLQTAAVLRTLKESNPEMFAEFMKEARASAQ